MRKWLIIGTIVVVLGGGGAAYLLTRDNGSNNNASSSNNNSSKKAPNFNPLTTDGASYVSTTEGTQSDGKTYRIQTENDGRGKLKNTSTVGDKTTVSYVDGSTYIICMGDVCYKSTTASSTSDYSIDSSQVSDWKKSVSYEGKATCGSATCDKWKSTLSTGSAEIFVKSDGQVVKSVVTASGNTFTTTYDYKPVTVTLPTNVRANPYSGALGN